MSGARAAGGSTLSFPSWKKSAVLRKSVAMLRRVPRDLARVTASAEAYRAAPPIIANSFPKSGTHLLIQLLEGIPGARNHGTFLASMPSLPFRERTPEATLRRIRKFAPGEVVSAHLFFAPDYADALNETNAVHYFVYRDLRDVAVSEAHYLTHMNRWHKLHRFFRELPSDADRLMFAINGATDPAFPYSYPNIGERFRRYAGWLRRREVFAVRFEELRSDGARPTIARMMEHYAERTTTTLRTSDLLERALGGMDPARSHTFHRGETGGWRKAFTSHHRDRMKAVAGDLLVELGYESDTNW